MDLNLKGNEWENVKEIKYKEEKIERTRSRIHTYTQ